MENPQITVYGYGYVGKAVFNFLKDHYTLQVVDPVFTAGVIKDEQAHVWLDGYENIKTKHAVICVPTKMNDDGSCDTSIVEDIIKNSDHDFYLIKSTVLPGTIKRLSHETGKSIAFSPEYIGEGKYEIPFWQDYPHPTNMKLHSFHIFGGPKDVTKEFLQLWQKVAGWTAKYIQTDSTTAELVKYMENSFLGTKKVFCDEFYEIAKALNVDYNELKELWLLDGRVGRSMTLIFPDKRGFGGKCLPKDINAIVKVAESSGYNPELLKEVLKSNSKFVDKSMTNEDIKFDGEATPETPETPEAPKAPEEGGEVEAEKEEADYEGQPGEGEEATV